MDKVGTIELSVIIAVYNAEQYLQECIDKLSYQTKKNVEFIFVNDGSSDKSKDLIERFLDHDDRGKLINLSLNSGTLLARAEGIKAAQGRYCTFLDPDDFYLSSSALEDVVSLIESYNVDILNFATKAFSDDDVEANIFESWVNVPNKKIRHNTCEIIDTFFIEGGSTWVLWNKVFKTKILKNVLKYIPNKYACLGEDGFILFLACLFSTSFLSVNAKPYYGYRKGSGLTQRSIDQAEYIAKYSKEPLIAEYLEKVLERLGCFDKYKKNVDHFRKILFRSTFSKLESLPTINQQIEAFKFLCEQNKKIHVINAASHYFYSRPWVFARLLSSVRFEKEKSRSIKTIGVLYHRYFEGGIERVMSYQIPMLMDLGYEVVLLTEIIDTKKEYGIPDGVRRAVITPSFTEGRAGDLQNVVKKFSIDLIITHMGSSPSLTFDLALLKTLGVYSIVINHELTFQDIISGPHRMIECINKPVVYDLADTLVVLSNCEKNFYSRCGVNVKFIPNPLGYISPNLKSEGRDLEYTSPRILWVGRLDFQQKNIQDALKIFHNVVKELPKVKIDIVGPEFALGAKQFVLDFISKNGLEANITLQQPQNDVSPYFRASSVVLCTSSFESFGMVIAESKLFGVPLVVYDMPYLELLRSNKGYISVPQHDIDKASFAIIKLLTNPQLRERLAREARESINSFIDMQDIKNRWNKVINELTVRHTNMCTIDENTLLMLSQIEQFASFWGDSLQNSNAERIKIHRYDVMVHIFSKYFPPQSKRRQFVLRFAKWIYSKIR